MRGEPSHALQTKVQETSFLSGSKAQSPLSLPGEAAPTSPPSTP